MSVQEYGWHECLGVMVGQVSRSIGGTSVQEYGWEECLGVWMGRVFRSMGGTSVQEYGWDECLGVWVGRVSRSMGQMSVQEYGSDLSRIVCLTISLEVWVRPVCLGVWIYEFYLCIVVYESDKWFTCVRLSTSADKCFICNDLCVVLYKYRPVCGCL